MYQSIYDLSEEDINKLLVNNNVTFSLNDSLKIKLNLLENNNIFTIFIP